MSTTDSIAQKQEELRRSAFMETYSLIEMLFLNTPGFETIAVNSDPENLVLTLRVCSQKDLLQDDRQRRIVLRAETTSTGDTVVLSQRFEGDTCLDENPGMVKPYLSDGEPTYLLPRYAHSVVPSIISTHLLRN